MFKESRVLMDTFCTITVVSPSKDLAEEAIDAGFGEIKKLEILLNFFSEESEITAINRAAGIHPVKVSQETMEILRKMIEIAEVTDGSFDATIAPVIRQWKFSKHDFSSSVPDKRSVENALKSVSYKKINMNSNTSEIYLEEKGMELDLGGIAKGYGADKAVDAIKAIGIKAALVAVAGDIRGYGISPSGKAWKVGIQNPRTENTEKPWEDVMATLHLENKAISTSGDYQRYFIKDGMRYHHILDPKTGFPSDSGLISVSVIAPEGYLSDSLSTAVFIMGAEKGMRLLESMGIEGVLIDNNKNILVTRNLKGKIEILNSDYQLAEQ